MREFHDSGGAMRNTIDTSPELMPVLSPGRHRRPRSGACFMEFASYLAGERWSDHPRCTHALLAALARGINDCTSDAERSRLTDLIPRVIGLTTEDERLDLRIAILAAAAAVPIASYERQHALAAGLLLSQRRLSALDGAADPAISTLVGQAFAGAPEAERWARLYLQTHSGYSTRTTARHSGEAIVATAVMGIAFACVSDPDARLRSLLTAAIIETEAFIAAETARVAGSAEVGADVLSARIPLRVS